MSGGGRRSGWGRTRCPASAAGATPDGSTVAATSVSVVSKKPKIVKMKIVKRRIRLTRENWEYDRAAYEAYGIKGLPPKSVTVHESVR